MDHRLQVASTQRVDGGGDQRRRDEMRRRGNEDRARSGSYRRRPTQRPRPSDLVCNRPQRVVERPYDLPDKGEHLLKRRRRQSSASSGHVKGNVSAQNEHREGAHLRGKYAAFVLAPPLVLSSGSAHPILSTRRTVTQRRRAHAHAAAQIRSRR
jgi:hypothetical protein